MQQSNGPDTVKLEKDTLIVPPWLPNFLQHHVTTHELAAAKGKGLAHNAPIHRPFHPKVPEKGLQLLGALAENAAHSLMPLKNNVR